MKWDRRVALVEGGVATLLLREGASAIVVIGDRSSAVSQWA
jgi:hypothetical protein